MVAVSGVISQREVGGQSDLVFAEFYSMIQNEGLVHRRTGSWWTESKAKPDNSITEYRGYGAHYTFARHGEAVLVTALWPSNGQVQFEAAAKTAEAVDAVQPYLLDLYPKRPEKEKRVSVRFWSLGEHGPESVTRQIDAPHMSDIMPNYSDKVMETLNNMTAADFQAGLGGQLLLWHGPPGTGKTWALRGIALEWRKWCTIEYVVDPEAFFGKANYLIKVLLGSNNTEYVGDEEDDEDGAEPIEKWRLLIFEDTGELLSKDARTRAGQGLSRLLNTVDGFIGQGLKVLTLITTNEELGQLHEAVARPGRCAVKLQFDRLSVRECVRWAEANGVQASFNKSHTLAELYAIRDGFLVAEAEKRQVGFSAA